MHNLSWDVIEPRPVKRANIGPPQRDSTTWLWTGRTLFVCEQGVLEEDVSAPEWGLGTTHASRPVPFRQAAIGLEICLARDSKVHQRLQ